MDDSGNLIGKTITKIQMTADRIAIRFILDNGDVIGAVCDADCCSNTWIEDIIAPEFALGSPVLRTGDIDLPEEFRTPSKTGNYEEEMQYYGFFIETAIGRCTLAYRNSSNGYYGGWLTWDGEEHYAGVFGQQIPVNDFVDCIQFSPPK